MDSLFRILKMYAFARPKVYNHIIQNFKRLNIFGETECILNPVKKRKIIISCFTTLQLFVNLTVEHMDPALSPTNVNAGKAGTDDIVTRVSGNRRVCSRSDLFHSLIFGQIIQAKYLILRVY